MPGPDKKRSGISDAELKRWLNSAKSALPEPSPAFRETVMAAVRTHARLQNLGTWQRMPHSLARRFIKPVVVFFLAAVAAYLGSSAPRAPQTAAGPASTLVTVRFTLNETRANEVRLAGGFSQWEPRHVLQRDAHGIWTVEIPLQPGRHEYMFVVDGNKWVIDPAARQIQNDGYGGKNSVIVVNTVDSRKEHSHVEAI